MSWGSNAVHHCTSISNYDAAERHYNERKLPKGAAWSENERPLYENRHHHYRVVRISDTSYALYLYNTPVITYHKPEADGTYTTDYEGWGSQLTNNFLWQMGNVRNGRNVAVDASGEQVVWPLSSINILGKPYCARIVRDKIDHIIRERSEVNVFYTRVMSDEVKALRKKMGTALAHVIDLACMMPWERAYTGMVYAMHGRRAAEVESFVSHGTPLSEETHMGLLHGLVRGLHAACQDDEVEATPAMKAAIARKALLNHFFTSKDTRIVYPMWSVDVPEKAGITRPE